MKSEEEIRKRVRLGPNSLKEIREMCSKQYPPLDARRVPYFNGFADALEWILEDENAQSAENRKGI